MKEADVVAISVTARPLTDACVVWGGKGRSGREVTLVYLKPHFLARMDEISLLPLF